MVYVPAGDSGRVMPAVQEPLVSAEEEAITPDPNLMEMSRSAVKPSP